MLPIEIQDVIVSQTWQIALPCLVYLYVELGDLLISNHPLRPAQISHYQMLGNLKIVTNVALSAQCVLCGYICLILLSIAFDSLLMLFCQLGYFLACQLVCLFAFQLVCIRLLNLSACFCEDKEPRYTAANHLKHFKDGAAVSPSDTQRYAVCKIFKIRNRIQMKGII